MDTMTKPISLPRDCANLSIPPANMSVSHIPKPSVLNDKRMNERAEWKRLYMSGAQDSNCRRETNQIHKATAKHHRISHTARSVDTCTIKQARALVLIQSSCLEAVTHVLHNWDPQHKCVWEREREKLRSVSSPPLCSGSLVSFSVWTDWSTVSTRTREQREPFTSFILSQTTVVSPTLLLSFFPLSHYCCSRDFVRGQSLTVALFIAKAVISVDICHFDNFYVWPMC